MALQERNQVQRSSYELAESSFATRVYGWMSFGLLWTALIAGLVAQTGAYMALLPFMWVFALATLGVAIAIGATVTRISFGGMAALMLTYGALEGLFFGTILPFYAAAYGGQTIWAAFLTAGLIYGIAMLYGLFTRQNLSKLSRVFQVALIGLIAITLIYFIISFFVQVSWMILLISYLGLILFTALTAFDAQQIRALSHQVDMQSPMANKLALMMALKMYINVIMIFWYLLQILAVSRK